MGISIRKLLKNSSALMVSSFVVSLFAFLQGIIVTRTLGPADYGLWGLLTSGSAMIRSFLSFRLQEPLTRYLVILKDDHRGDKLLPLLRISISVEALSCLITFLLIFLIAPFLNFFFPQYQAIGDISRIFSFVALTGILDTVWYCIVRDQGGFLLLATASCLSALAQLIFVFAMWQVGGLNLQSMSLGFLAIGLLQISCYALHLIKIFRARYGITDYLFLVPQGNDFRKMDPDFWRFMKSTYWASSASAIVKNFDILISGRLFLPNQVGYYRLAKSMISMVMILGTSLTSVIYKDFLSLSQHEDKIYKDLLRGSKIWIPFILLGTVLLCFLAGPAVGYFYGSAFLPAAHYFKIMMIGVSLYLMLFWAQPIILALGLHREYFWIQLIGSFVGVVVMYVSALACGLDGLAFATGVFWAVVLLCMAVVALRNGGRK